MIVCITEPDGSITYPSTSWAVSRSPSENLLHLLTVLWQICEHPVEVWRLQYVTLQISWISKAKGRHESCICMVEHEMSSNGLLIAEEMSWQGCLVSAGHTSNGGRESQLSQGSCNTISSFCQCLFVYANVHYNI
jgi:hypothetical protein